MSNAHYQKVMNATASQRQLEAQALLRMALLMSDALAANNNEDLNTAVILNSRLWLFFYSQIESKQVTLPPDLESNIIRLVAYVVKVSPRAFGADPDTVNSLISINRNIAAGLSENPEVADIPPAPAQTSFEISA
ncbi:MAG TPA: hypothetical protein HPQ04_13125 [Rhodospirillaceae bacterium]|nr:hypothetical protein [Rhodospirillaceae bacterium]